MSDRLDEQLQQLKSEASEKIESDLTVRKKAIASKIPGGHTTSTSREATVKMRSPV